MNILKKNDIAVYKQFPNGRATAILEFACQNNIHSMLLEFKEFKEFGEFGETL